MTDTNAVAVRKETKRNRMPRTTLRSWASLGQYRVHADSVDGTADRAVTNNVGEFRIVHEFPSTS